MATITKAITLKPGESFTLPPGSELLFTSDGTGLSSDCQIPPDQQFSCFGIDWSLNDDNTPSPNLEHQVSNVEYLEIAGVQYPLNMDTHQVWNGGGFLPDQKNEALINALAAKLPPYLIQLSKVVTSTSGGRIAWSLYFRTVTDFGPTVRMKITGDGFVPGLYVYAYPSDQCEGSNT
jgi:hypothetical protein